MRELVLEVRHAFRALTKAPAVTALALVSLGLGIGATTTIFTLINAVFLRGLPVERPEELMVVYGTDERQGQGGNFMPVSRPNFEDYRDRSQVFSGLADLLFAGATLSTGEGEPEQVAVQLASGNFFEVLGVRPALGRFFTAAEDEVAGRDPVVVLHQRLWRERFGADPGVVGRTVSLNARPFTVVGVAPEGFNGPFALGAPGFWAPAMAWETFLTGAALENFNDRRALLTFVFGRLKPGVSMDQAQAALQVIGRNLAAEYPQENGGRNVGLLPLAQASIPPQIRDDFERAGGLLMVVVGLVLLIACANVANLLLGRALGRRREIAVRLSMGASRGRLVRQLLAESLLLSLLAGVVGLVLAFWGRNLLWSFRPPFLQNAPFDLSLDSTVLGFTLAVSLATGLLFGLVPALQATRPAVVDDLKQGAEGARRSFRVLSLRNALVVGQVTLCFVALIGSGLFLRSLGKAMRIDPGFDAERVGMMSFNVGAVNYDRPRGEQFYDALLERARAVPGVEAAELAANVPLFFGGFMRTVIVEGRDDQAENNRILTAVDAVGGDYFKTLGVPIVSGRALADADRADAPFVAVFNETAARRFWPDEDPLGKRFRFFGEDWVLEVVGIARDSKYFTIGEDPTAYIYLPRRQHYNQVMNLLIRTSGDPTQVTAKVRGEARALDANLPITNVQPVAAVVGGSLWPARMAAGLLGILGALALVLAVMGIYGVMSYVVGQRRREIGIRMALGAEQGSVVGLFLRQGMAIVAVGLLVGILAAAVAGRFIESLLYGLSGTDFATFGLTALVFLGVAFLANLIPARRASGIDPVVVLKTER